MRPEFIPQSKCSLDSLFNYTRNTHYYTYKYIITMIIAKRHNIYSSYFQALGYSYEYVVTTAAFAMGLDCPDDSRFIN